MVLEARSSQLVPLGGDEAVCGAALPPEQPMEASAPQLFQLLVVAGDP